MTTPNTPSSPQAGSLVERDAMINRTEAEWDALQDALGTQPGWKVGRVLSEQDIADLSLIDKCHREDEEAATDAYHRGWEDGLRERGGNELVEFHERLGRMFNEKVAEKVMRKFAEARAAKAATALEKQQVLLEKAGKALEEIERTSTDLSAHIAARQALNDMKGSENE